jgi:hypothetical protein
MHHADIHPLYVVFTLQGEKQHTKKITTHAAELPERVEGAG